MMHLFLSGIHLVWMQRGMGDSCTCCACGISFLGCQPCSLGFCDLERAGKEQAETWGEHNKVLSALSCPPWCQSNAIWQHLASETHHVGTLGLVFHLTSGSAVPGARGCWLGMAQELHHPSEDLAGQDSGFPPASNCTWEFAHKESLS